MPPNIHSAGIDPTNRSFCRPQLVLFYHIAMAYAISAILVLHFGEVRRPDHGVMLIHHFISLGLVAGSYYLDFLPVGCMVLLCHDCNDVLMELAKLFKYAGWKRSSNLTFAGFTVSWVLTRLYAFPFIVIRACFVHLNGEADVVPIGAYLLEALLCLLVLIHVYWTVLIVNMMIEALRPSNKQGLDVEVSDMKAVVEAADRQAAAADKAD